VLTAPGQIDPDTAKRLEDRWQEDFEGEENSGKIAVIGSGAKFESMMMSMVDSEITAQMEWSATQICSVFAMPPWKIGLGDSPRGIINVQALAVDYLSGCLQRYVVAIEACLTLGLGLSAGLKVSLDETELLRMDALTMGAYLGNLVGGGILAPNEARGKLGFGPVPGGDNVFMQQQMWSLEALASPSRGPVGALPPPPVAPKMLSPMNPEEAAAFLLARPAPEDDDDE
jgi:HK97 family phage portal protein